MASPHLGSRLDATLARDLFLLSQSDGNPTAERRLELAGWKGGSHPALRVFLYLPTALEADMEARFGFYRVKVYPHTYLPAVGAHKWGFVLAEATPDGIAEVMQAGLAVRAAAAYRRLSPLNDLAAEETGAAQGHAADPPLRGRGVRIAVLDSGFQLDHPDLPEPAAAMDYADYPDTSADVTDLLSGHGTHVAGTVFGSGGLSEGRWQGMAPEASAVYLKIGNDSTTEASTAAVVGALRAAATWCEADIATMSYGGYDGFNDGSSPEEQAVDWAVGEGVTVFMSAGNAAQRREVFTGTVAGGQVTSPIRILVRPAPPETPWQVYLSWWDGADTSVHLPLDFAILGANQLDTLDCDDPGWISSPRGTELRQLLPWDYLPTDTATFYVRVANRSEREQRFHLRVEPGYYLRFSSGGESYTVGLPSTADSCISVGAYVSRTEWTDYEGNHHDDRTTRGALAAFSSHGPRIDGVLKPDITAPGKQVISCRNTDRIPLHGEHGLDYRIVANSGGVGEPADYIALEGTSMSSPCAAGTAALLLEANPELSPAALRRILFETARSDSFTMATPNFAWGWGKVDLMEALAVGDGAVSESYVPRQIEITGIHPNPFNGQLTVRLALREAARGALMVYDSSGRLVGGPWDFESGSRSEITVPLNFADFPAGKYFIKAASGSEVAFAHFTLVR